MFDNKLVHQTQPTPMGCVCTCIAMLMGEDAQSVIDRYHEKYYVERSMDVGDILAEEAFIFRREMAGTVLTLYPGSVYLLTVASLNIPGSLHQILVDYRDTAGPVVLDPAKGYGKRKYYTFDQTEADEVNNAFLLFSWIVDYTITDRG